MRRHRPDELGRIAPGLQLAQGRPRVAVLQVLQIRIPLVVEIVQEAGQSPQLDVAVEPRRVRAHRRLDGQHVAPERVRSCPFTKKVPGRVSRKLNRHGGNPS